MTLEEIVEKCRELSVYEKRCITNKYSELVFYTEEVDQWNRVFTDILDSAVKPAGRHPTKEDQRLAKEYGGIHNNQTLFKKEFEGDIVLAMFWPWQDNMHITLKMILLKK